MREETKPTVRPQARPRPGGAARAARPNIQLKTKNWALLGAGIVTIIAGYITLSMGSITLAPILLVAGYCVLVPVAILVK